MHNSRGIDYRAKPDAFLLLTPLHGLDVYRGRTKYTCRLIIYVTKVVPLERSEQLVYIRFKTLNACAHEEKILCQYDACINNYKHYKKMCNFWRYQDNNLVSPHEFFLYAHESPCSFMVQYLKSPLWRIMEALFSM